MMMLMLPVVLLLLLGSVRLVLVGILLRLLLLRTKLLGHVHVHLKALVAVSIDEAMLVEHGKRWRIGAGRAIGRWRILRVKGNARGRGYRGAVASLELARRRGLIVILARSLEPKGTIGHLGMQDAGDQRRAAASFFLQH